MKACATPPFLIPPPRSVCTDPEAAGWCVPSEPVLATARTELVPIVRHIAEELRALGLAPTVASSGGRSTSDAAGGLQRQVEPAAIRLSLGSTPWSSSPEAYRLTIDAAGATIQGATPHGVHLGSRTLLQLLSRVLPGRARASDGAAGASDPVQSPEGSSCAAQLPALVIEDEPACSVRAFHLDAARKHFSLDWLTDQVREISWVKLNELQLHLSEDEGFRLQLTGHPEVVSAEHLTQDELLELLDVAAAYHIRVVPSLDVPGHMSHVLRAHPDLRAGDTPAGRRILDYSRPESRALVTELIEEVAPLFPSTAWHLGGDEVFPLDGATWRPDEHERMAREFPRLLAYAREHAAAGEGATVLDGYVAYLNTVVARLRGLGKTDVRVWNDALALPGVTERIDPGVTVTYWTAWHEGFAPVTDFADAGHRVLNFNDVCFYDVLTTPGRAYDRPPEPAAVYEWAPGLYPRHRTEGEQDWRGAVPSWDRGAAYSIWCDVPEARTEEEVARRARPWRRILASRAWNPDDSVTWERWRSMEAALPGPPTPQP